MSPPINCGKAGLAVVMTHVRVAPTKAPQITTGRPPTPRREYPHSTLYLAPTCTSVLQMDSPRPVPPKRRDVDDSAFLAKSRRGLVKWLSPKQNHPQPAPHLHERLEEARDGLLGHAGPVVFDLDVHATHA